MIPNECAANDSPWPICKPCVSDGKCKISDRLRAAQVAILWEAIHVVEAYKVSVGNSSAGERAAEMTMENLREVRDELRRIADELESTEPTPHNPDEADDTPRTPR